MTCGTCKHHHYDVNNPQDRRMSELGWKLCNRSEDQMKAARYLHVNAQACGKYELNVLHKV